MCRHDIPSRARAGSSSGEPSSYPQFKGFLGPHTLVKLRKYADNGLVLNCKCYNHWAMAPERNGLIKIVHARESKIASLRK